MDLEAIFQRCVLKYPETVTAPGVRQARLAQLTKKTRFEENGSMLAFDGWQQN